MLTDNTQEKYSILDLGFDNLLTKFSSLQDIDLITPEMINNFTSGLNTKMLGAGELGGLIGSGHQVIAVAISDNIQTAIEKVNNLGGGTVLLEGGIHKPNYNIVLYSNVALVGQEGGSTIIDFDNQAYQVQCFGTDTYATGTISIADGGATVTGVGTAWTTSMEGQSILLSGAWYLIATVGSATSITLDSTFSGTFNISADTYVIANYISRADIINITLQNSTVSTGTVYYRYSYNCFMTQTNHLDSTRGFTVQDSSFPIVRDNNVLNCGTGAYWIQVGLLTYEDFGIIDSTTGDGMNMYKCSNYTFFNWVSTNNVGNGVTLDSCNDCGIFDFTVNSNIGHGVEFINSNNIQILNATISNNTDGIKLTSTSDHNILIQMTLKNNTRYGINIAASTCDNNELGNNSYQNNTLGSIQDLGIGTNIS